MYICICLYGYRRNNSPGENTRAVCTDMVTSECKSIKYKYIIYRMPDSYFYLLIYFKMTQNIYFFKLKRMSA